MVTVNSLADIDEKIYVRFADNPLYAHFLNKGLFKRKMRMHIDVNLIFSALDKTCDSSWVKERDKIKQIENR
jgi:hypothetical protein